MTDKGNPMYCWNVYLGNRLIDSVYYTKDCDREYVKSSLINHDGYNSNIVVKKVTK